MNTQCLHGKDTQSKIANHKNWLIYPLYHSIAWTNIDTLIKYKNREYILTGLAQPITRIKKCVLMSNLLNSAVVPSDTLALYLGEPGYNIRCFINYKDPNRVCHPLITRCSEDYALYNKIELFLKEDPNQDLTAEDQNKIIDLAQKSGLLLESNQYQASIAIPLSSDDIDGNIIKEDVKNDVYKLTSILGWYFGGYVDVDQSKEFNQSSPVSFNLREANVVKYAMAYYDPSNSYDFDCNSLPIINDEKINMALSFWREGLKLKDIHAGFAFLSFYKVIESQFTAEINKDPNKGCKKWIADNLKLIPDDTLAKKRINYLLSQKQFSTNEEIKTYLFKSIRSAVAHASSNAVIINPDIPLDREKLVLDLTIMETLAALYIGVEKDIKSSYPQGCYKRQL
jgi:hypothetical protein